MIARILQFSIYNRLFVLVITLVTAFYGLYALKKLPIDAVPDITNQQVQINATASGLSPFDIEKQITFPIENALSSIPGLEMTRSISRSGFSQVTAIFKESIDLYFARQQINEKLTEAKEWLPEGVEPKMGPISTGLGEVYMWAVDYQHPGGIGATIRDGTPGWQSDGTYLTPEGLILKNRVELFSYLRTVQDWIIKPQLKTVAGIADIDSIGGFNRQYHITPDPQKMIALGVSFSDLIDSLELNNISAGAGYLEFKNEGYVVQSDHRVKNFNHISDLVIRTKEGVPIRIKDVADVGIGEELRSGSASKDGREAVIGTAMMLIGSNSRTVSSAVNKKLEEVSRSLPEDIVITTTLNRTKLVDATIKTVFLNLSEGALLVILILFLMLHNFRAALICAAVIPLSMLVTSIGMVKFKMSGNLMSLGALDFGLIVDGAIIITENCLRRIGEKQRALKRGLKKRERLEEIALGAKEMIQPTVYGQAIIMIVYAPILALQGVEGKMFHPMALTVIFALIAAFILSLTFVPAMIALIVSRKVADKESGIIRKLKMGYQWALVKILRRPLPLMACSLILIGGSLIAFFALGQEFVPTLDERDIAMHAIRIPSTSFESIEQNATSGRRNLSQTARSRLRLFKNGDGRGGTDPMPPNVSDTFIMLKPRNQWPDPALSKEHLIERLEAQLEVLPGNIYEFTQPIEMRFNELIAGTRGDLAIKIYGDDYAILEKVGSQISHILRTIPGAEDISATQAEGMPTFDISIDRESASRLGLRIKDIFDLVTTAIGGTRAGTLFEGDRRFDIFVRLPEAMRHDLTTLENLPVLLPDEHRGSISYPYVPLKEVAQLNMREGINEISRENGKRVFIVQANVRGRDLGSFVEEAKREVKAELKLPPGYWIGWGGQFENLESARRQLVVLVPLCFLLIFFLLL